MGSTRRIIKRGKRYSYVSRIPKDLRPLFPFPTIWKSLQVENLADARILATAEEFRTQQLFMQLRSGMLSKELEKRLIAVFLNTGLKGLEQITSGNPQGEIKAAEEFAQAEALNRGYPAEVGFSVLSRLYQKHANEYKDALAKRDPEDFAKDMDKLSVMLQKSGEKKLSTNEKKALAMKFMNAMRQIKEVQAALYEGDWAPMEQLREKIDDDLSAPYHSLNAVLEKYQEHYLASRPNVTPGSKDDMAVECRVLREIFGNISLSEFNSMESVAKLKKTLLKYPKNKQQRYGNKSIHSILRHESGYETISKKTANNYIQRAVSVVDYALKAEMVSSANKYRGERFISQTAAEEERSAYDSEDIQRLVNALCTQPLWRYNPPRPERFWIVLISLFHGFRLGNIILLTKEDICQTDKGTWIFRLRTGKSKATVRPVAISDALILLGFLEWVDGLKRDKLFLDSADSFSKWYNRTDKKADGSVYTGFEGSHVTTDPKKCLYSLRHSFAGNVFDVTDDYKITADMMGHSTAGSVTARYTKQSKAETLKQVTDKMQLDNIDLDLLEARARELFFVE